MGNTPFAMSFDEIKAQAEANMQADKGGTAAPQPVTAAPTVAQSTAQKSFRDMVEEAERELAGGEKADKEASATASAVVETAPTETAIPGNISFDELYAQAESSTATPVETEKAPAAGSLSFDELVKQASEGTTQQAAQPEPVKEASEPASQPQPAAKPNSFDALMADALAQTKAEGTENAGTATGISFDNIIAQMEAANKPTPMAEGAMNPPVETSVEANTEVPVEAFVEAKTEIPVEAPVEAKTETPVEAPVEAKTEAPVEMPVEAKTETPVEAPVETKAEEPAKAQAETKKAGKKSGTKKDKKAEEPKEPLPDTTDEYRVDVLGEGDPKAVENPEVKASKDQKKESADAQSISFDTLFTSEEIAMFRADIRTFVRKEFKAAMVDVVKELLTNFSE